MRIVINFIDVFLIWLSSSFRCFSVEQLIRAFRTKVFKVLHFQLLGAKEYKFIYKLVHAFFLDTVVSIFPGFLIIKISRKGMVLSFSISNVNFIFLWKELSAYNMLSMYSDLVKQYVSSTNLFHSFTLLSNFGITDVSSSTMNMFASTGLMVNSLPHHLLERKFRC